MSRPKIELSNHSEIYDYYRKHQQGPHVARFLHGTLGLVFRPKVGFDPNAEDKLSQVFAKGRTVVLASNHIKAVDPCVIAALPAREPALEPVAGTTFIPSKRSIFKNTVVRHLVDGLGAVPVFREKDVAETDDPRHLRAATRALLETCIAKMNAGEHMAIFPEGTRNTVDSRRVQQLQGGLGLMLCRVTKVEQPAIVPIGIQYSESGVQRTFTPNVWVGQPSEEPFAKPRDLMDWLPDQLQSCVDNAAELG